MVNILLFVGSGQRDKKGDPTPRDLEVLAILGESGTGLADTFGGDAEEDFEEAGENNENIILAVVPDNQLASPDLQMINAVSIYGCYAL